MSLLTTNRADMCYCPGCSHGVVLEHLGRALDHSGVPSQNIVIVSDIGCIGTADRYFSCHTFHGLHGRSITYAEGIKRARPELLVVVLIGDGGCGIGTAHLVHAARRNADIKVVVCNNFNFGMTGGQHSPTTPPCASTTTTPAGASDFPFDICNTVACNGANYSARVSVFDPALGEMLKAALLTPGFVLLDIWELCTAYFLAANKLNRSSLEELSRRLELPFGVIRTRQPAATRSALAKSKVQAGPTPSMHGKPSCRIPWTGRREICVAGSAGQRIRSAVGVIGEIAVACGLFAVQQDDFPITVRRGFSLSNLIIASEPIHYSGLDSPGLVVVFSPEGLQRFGVLSRLSSTAFVFAPSDLPLESTPATVRHFDMQVLEKRVGPMSAGLAALTLGLIQSGLMDPSAFRAAADATVGGPYRASNLTAIDAGTELALQLDSSVAMATI